MMLLMVITKMMMMIRVIITSGNTGNLLEFCWFSCRFLADGRTTKESGRKLEAKDVHQT